MVRCMLNMCRNENHEWRYIMASGFGKFLVTLAGIATTITGGSNDKIYKNYRTGGHREQKASIERRTRSQQWSNRGGKKHQK